VSEKSEKLEETYPKRRIEEREKENTSTLPTIGGYIKILEYAIYMEFYGISVFDYVR